MNLGTDYVCYGSSHSTSGCDSVETYRTVWLKIYSTLNAKGLGWGATNNLVFDFFFFFLFKILTPLEMGHKLK